MERFGAPQLQGTTIPLTGRMGLWTSAGRPDFCPDFFVNFPGKSNVKVQTSQLFFFFLPPCPFVHPFKIWTLLDGAFRRTTGSRNNYTSHMEDNREDGIMDSTMDSTRRPLYLYPFVPLTFERIWTHLNRHFGAPQLQGTTIPATWRK
jgi:hypothetical protein